MLDCAAVVTRGERSWRRTAKRSDVPRDVTEQDALMQPRSTRHPATTLIAALLLAAPLIAATPSPRAARAAAGSPDILLVTIDTLRADRLGAYGYPRATSPHLDALIRDGVRFDAARTIEPLTTPALVSMLTSTHPHEHGASRNGLRMHSGLASLPKTLQASGYRTAAFVANWTLRDKLSGLSEHFADYHEVLTRRRWFGLVRSEATAQDITGAAMEWIETHHARPDRAPYFVWVHYVDPHAPYRLHEDYLERLGLPTGGGLPAEDRYDTEIAFVDDAVGALLAHVTEGGAREPLIVFTSDHGESLGEHGYWGHGRNLHDPTLLIPMSVTWPGRIEPRTIDAPALIIDLAPTVLGLLGLQPPANAAGYDWSGVFKGAEPPASRTTHYQAHRGAVISRHDSDLARRSGLLEVGVIDGSRKEIFRVNSNRRETYDLINDPHELHDLSADKQPPSEMLLGWMRRVYDGLTSLDDAPPEPLDEESIEQLRSLGYVD